VPVDRMGPKISPEPGYAKRGALSRAFTVLLAIAAVAHDGPVRGQDEADQLVQQLREFRAALPAARPSNGVPDPVEERRRQVYTRLRDIGEQAMPALIRALADPDIQVRRNVVLFLDVAAGSWYDLSRPKMNIQSALPALMTSLEDRDERVRGLAAQAIGEIGPNAAAAVPALIKLLNDPSEGSRNSACIGLAGIGPAANIALPVLRSALSDSSVTVRRFAQRAIERIDVR
jgi:HEAT repeat protein